MNYLLKRTDNQLERNNELKLISLKSIYIVNLLAIIP
jgi:hypothetical protein